MKIAITPRQRRRARLWAEMVRVARGDLGVVAGEIAALEGEVEADRGPARDAYYAAVGHQREGEAKLTVARSLDDLRASARLADLARKEIAGARALLRGEAPPSGDAACFFDPGHGPSARSVLFAPEGGDMRHVPACGACAEEVEAGRAPAIRRVLVNGHPEPYWRSPAHAGYYGAGSGSLDDLLSIPGPGFLVDALLELATELFDY